MISFNEALDILLATATPFGTGRCSLASSPGRILADDILSDVDMPPFNKSAVDGYACRISDLPLVMKPDVQTRPAAVPSHTASRTPGGETRHAASLQMVGIIPAGTVPTHPIGPGECAKIMTGAMVPEGADTVIMVEDTEELPDGRIRFTADTTAPNICYKGEDIRQGDLVLPGGSLISPPGIAVLASVGAVSPTVYKQPKVAVISTGDELVDPKEIPGPAKIRNSNSSQLIAQLGQMHLEALGLGISGDSKEELYAKIDEGLAKSDVLILSGGVSMGEYDYVPGIMSQLGVEILFKSIAIQPGRPTLFGRRGSGFVFGLPGNPVSSFVIFEILVKPFLFKLMGHTYSPPLIRLPLGVDFRRKKSSRKSMLPVFIREGEIFPVDYHGSAHIHSYIKAEGMISIEIGTTERKKGELQDVRLL